LLADFLPHFPKPVQSAIVAPMKIIITGGGIGGLTAALCLIRAGHQVTVLEQARELAEVGAGIQISPNSAKVLAALGLLPALEAVAFKPRALEMRLGASGKSVFSLPIDAACLENWGGPYLHVHRAALVDVLAGALAERSPGCLRTDAAVAALEQGEASVTVTLASGERLSGDLLVGADGIHSVVRAFLLGPDSPRFTGNVAWRAVVPVERLKGNTPPPTACVWVGPGRHAVTYLLDGGRLANFVGVVETSAEPEESWTGTGAQARALADFAGFDPVITGLIEQADNLFLWSLRDRPVLSTWHESRTVLLGDACHPMLPFLAQGASMAIEDAWVLAACLEESGLPASLARYEAIRKPRASRVQAASRQNMGLFHRQSRLAQLATYGPAWLAGQLMPGVLRSRQDWIYSHDVTCSDDPVTQR
jgi:salicylate hydroxylase